MLATAHLALSADVVHRRLLRGKSKTRGLNLSESEFISFLAYRIQAAVYSLHLRSPPFPSQFLLVDWKALGDIEVCNIQVDVQDVSSGKPVAGAWQRELPVDSN